MAKRTATPREGSPLIGVLKQTIRDSGLSLNELAKRSGVDDSQLSRFLRGERDISLSATEKLVQFFGLKLVKSKGKGK